MARQVGDIIAGLSPDGRPTNIGVLLDTLNRYAGIIRPWAAAAAEVMLADVERRNERMWKDVGKEMSKALREELKTTPQGIVYKELLDENVGLITSLPIKAGERVQKLVTEGLATGRRAESISREILASGKVTKSRARLIARTEVARAAATLTQARAMSIGSEGYIWRTSEDSDVRETHKKMNGKYVRWDDPPKTDISLDPYHAGCGPNCRCYAEPVFPDL